MSQLLVLAASAGMTFLFQLVGFALSFALKTEVLYDVWGGLNFLALAAYSSLYSPPSSEVTSADADHIHGVAATVLFVWSRGWLLLFLAWRAYDRKGDARFEGVVGRPGLFLVYWTFQALWVLFVSLPLLYINASSVRSEKFTPLDMIAQCGWALGIFLEMLADGQKAIWIKLGRPGGFCFHGVWRYSRHPNYFGEMMQWWCAWLLACSSSKKAQEASLPLPLGDPLWWACALSPLFTSFLLLLLPGTGIANAEGKNLKRYYDKCPAEYAEYRRRTSPLLPMVGYRYVPLCLKRTVFLDLERYEYRPGPRPLGEKTGRAAAAADKGARGETKAD